VPAYMSCHGEPLGSVACVRVSMCVAGRGKGENKAAVRPVIRQRYVPGGFSCMPDMWFDSIAAESKAAGPGEQGPMDQTTDKRG